MVESGTFMVNEGCINLLLLIRFIGLIQVLLKKMKVVKDYG